MMINGSSNNKNSKIIKNISDYITDFLILRRLYIYLVILE